MLKRTPFKRKIIKYLKRSPIKKKPPSIEKLETDRIQREKDIEFYMKIWNSRPHKCEVCGIWLGNEMKPIFMDHLLEKTIYPELRYEESNIGLICPQHHSMKTMGFPDPIHQQLINNAKQKFLS